MGRPRLGNDVRMQTRIDGDTVRYLDGLVAITGKSRAAVVRQVLHDFFELAGTLDDAFLPTLTAASLVGHEALVQANNEQKEAAR